MELSKRLDLDCTICGSEEKLVRDHCHETDYVRGVLCDRCNYFLGIYCNEKKGGDKCGWTKYKKWKRKYKKLCEEYLAETLHFKYESTESKVLLRIMQSRGVHKYNRYRPAAVEVTETGFIKIH